ncbi:MAG: T9SS type A sorting domain-containing protein [Saprospiraceae bacterium]
MKHALLFYVLFSIASADLSAQNHADCAEALEICNKHPLTLPMFGAGNDSTEFDSAPCFSGFPNPETSSAWIRWQIAQSGTLWFVIYPLNITDDIDFLVFRVPMGNCAEKAIVRCMAAGDFSLSSPCMGPTGLRPGEIDTLGPPGCAAGLNNFLAPLNVVAGEQYILAINNYSSNQDTVRVEFCGTALLGCETEMCTVLGDKSPNALSELSIGNIVPNPVSSMQSASISVYANRSESTLVRVSDVRGQTLWEQQYVLDFGSNTLDIPTQKLRAGVYFVSVFTEKMVRTYRLVVRG